METIINKTVKEVTQMKKDLSTARPWKFDSNTGGLFDSSGNIAITLGTSGIHKANTELIVLAVNNHESLLEACESALMHIQMYSCNREYTKSSEDKLEHAIKKAKGE